MRRFHASILPTIFGFVLAATTPALAEWGTTQGNAAHDGYIPMTVISTAPKLLWSDANMPVLSAFAVGGGQLFYTTHQPGAGWVENLYAVNEQTGAVAWNFNPAQSAGDPAYSSGNVYLQVDFTQNAVLGWNAQTHAQLFSGAYANQFSTYLAPVISNGVLYAGGGYYGGQVYAYNTATSAVNWIATPPITGSYGSASPAVDANYVYFTAGGGSDLIIANKATGVVLSQTGPKNESGSTSPLLTGNGGLFYVDGDTGKFFNITNPTSPTLTWSMSNINGSHYAAYANGNLYVSANINNTPTLYALNALTGQQEWSLTGAGGIGNLVVTDNMLFASQGTNTVAISLTTHQVLWSVPLTGTLAVSDNELFIGSDNTVSAFAIAVPEPSSFLLLATSTATLLLRRNRQRRQDVN